MSALLRLEKISKYFSNVRALDNISLSIAPGEIIALLGDNGAGKSSLINIISGIFKPSEGNMFWKDSLLEYSGMSAPKQARQLGIQTVYQHLALIDKLSITQNFFLGREIIKSFGPFHYLDNQGMRGIVLEEIQKMGIARALDPDESVTCLSGGERQALAVARAKYFNAKLLILDEPTSALSVKQTEEVLNVIRDAAKSGIAVILITHDLSILPGLVDRALIMYHGQLVADLNDNINVEVVREYITKGSMA